MSTSWDDAPAPRHRHASDATTHVNLPPHRLDDTRDVKGPLYPEPRRPSQRMSAVERRELPYTVLGWVLVALSVEVVVIVTVLGYHLLPGLLRGH